MGSGFAKKKKQAKQFQNQLMQAQEQLSNTTYTGTAGNGLVNITISGDFEIKKVSIAKECVDPEDVEGLELLVTAAFKDAAKQAQDSSMPNLGGLGDLGALGGLGGLGAGFPGLGG
jgi:DNA-binding YbaB/EbfC family protein